MTNGEKFKEVFGYTIDDFPADPCAMIDHTICANWIKGCSKCPLYHFWNKKYKKPKMKMDSKESIPYLMHKEMNIPLLECQKAYDVAIDYLRRQGKVSG